MLLLWPSFIFRSCMALILAPDIILYYYIYIINLFLNPKPYIYIIIHILYIL